MEQVRIENGEDEIKGMLVVVARSGLALAETVRRTRGKLYSDGFHKAVTAEIAALNTTQNACGKIIVREAMQNRAVSLTSHDVTRAALSEGESRDE